ncbi:MAG: BBP7 family outer membrane beta-barrel protein [Planctomycetales bacterium]|nr:BBP7 family outer membrane beta-barrel protein [Planctomycetales bacterium]
MSLLNLALRVIAAVTVMVASPSLMAQGKNLPNGPAFHPFAEPLEFDPDWQFFAPVDVDSMLEKSPRKRANTGWFAAYDRTHLWVSRPATEASANTGDFGWGNRFDVGFMTTERTGWFASFRHISGPNMYDNIYQERLNRVNTDDTNSLTDPVQPFIDANDPQLGTRAYVLQDSLNVFNMSNFELNKTWRREPYRYGGIIEPMVGFKYMNVDDLAVNQSYARSLLPLTGGAATTDQQVETFTSRETRIKNQMVGGQLGARYFTHYNRWTLSGELRAFGMANFQARDASVRSLATQYSGGAGINTGVTATDYSTGTGFAQTTNTEFVFGFEARAQAAYQVTKGFSLRGGLDVIDFAQGIWRAANPGFGNINENNQDVQLAGYTFGLEFNR